MNRLTAAIASLALLATLAVAAPASAHTGAITNTQSCDTGTVVTVTLHDDVAATSTWRVTVRGHQIDSGYGPGPDQWSYSVGKAAGSATLYIDFLEENEHNHYSTAWPAIERLPTRASSPSCSQTWAVRPVSSARLAP